MKKNVRAMYFYAYWDDNFELKNQFMETCKLMNIPFEAVDCETEFGIKLSCKYNVKLCPTILIFKGNKEVYRSHSKDSIYELSNYVK